MSNLKNSGEKSFTLVELLLVISIIGILASVVSVGVADAIDQARLAKAKAFSKSIEKSLVTSSIGKYNNRVESVYGDIYLRDESSSKKDGRVWNGTATSSDTPFGSSTDQPSLSFDGDNDYVWIPEYNSPVGALKPVDQLTVSAFFKISDYSVSTWWSSIVSAKEYIGSESGYLLGVTNTGHLYGRISINGYVGGNLEVTGSGAVSNNKWHHAALTYSKDTRKAVVYLDGKRDGEVSLPLSYLGDGCIIYDNPSNDVRIGEDHISGKIFKGLISNVQIYSANF